MSVGPTAAQLETRLQERLAPTRLEVVDESYQHAGHVGANDTGFGTHFAFVRGFTRLYRFEQGGPPPACA